MPDDYIFCPICNITPLIHDHPELHDWYKCSICGYSQKKVIKSKENEPRKSSTTE